ncbi:hypothetical protein [Entomomonas asaccharolytica]|uniref:Uncharacterized protein n=1 Tax=Entomomonas asaccharolytica TaxID=2785331 RepID=A0A974NIC3_9GAMM|nr:hypothetical protein [Entomomonas asaccharolytica]QQP87039.1 hypothetical protein JHT90_07290 [Entomomonas asaccharolytica]
MSKVIVKRVMVAFICVIIIPSSFYLLLKGFQGARYYQRYIEAPKLAWNQIKTIEAANLPSDALIEANLNSKIIDWSVNGKNVNRIIRLFRFRELAIKEQENKLLLCDLQRYRLKRPITKDYYDVIFNDSANDNKQNMQQLKAYYIQEVNNNWLQILNLSCEAK